MRSRSSLCQYSPGKSAQRRRTASRISGWLGGSASDIGVWLSPDRRKRALGCEASSAKPNRRPSTPFVRSLSRDRESVEWGKSVVVRVDHRGSSSIKNNTHKREHLTSK